MVASGALAPCHIGAGGSRLYTCAFCTTRPRPHLPPLDPVPLPSDIGHQAACICSPSIAPAKSLISPSASDELLECISIRRAQTTFLTATARHPRQPGLRPFGASPSTWGTHYPLAAEVDLCRPPARPAPLTANVARRSTQGQPLRTGASGQ